MPGRRPVSLALAIVLTVLVAPPALGSGFDDPAAAKPDATVYAPAFADVPVDHVFAAPVRAVLAAGITVGCDERSTRYCPDDQVSRGQMAAFLTRALDLPEEETVEFVDDDDHVFEDAIESLAAAGITLGCNPPDNDRFCPDREVTRGQMAAFLTRALPLDVPPAIPAGVEITHTATSGSGRGTHLEVCRGLEQSLIIRSVTGAIPELVNAITWEPTTFVLSDGEVDLASDRWYLPSGAGCADVDVAWDPRANTVAAPLPSLEVTSPFGNRRHPILGGVRLHAGTDFEADAGDPVFAAAAGVVVFAGTRGGYGGLVEIRHVGGLDTLYAHLSSLNVSIGDPVETGDVIGSVGCTGLCTGPHLHFETREFGEPVDPMSYLQAAAD